MRFKELRGLTLDILLLGMDIILIARNLNDKTRVILCVILSSIILMSFVSQFYVKVLKDSVYFYRFFGVILIPSLVEMKDIQEITQKSKCHLIIKTELKKYHIYVLNAEKLKEAIQTNMEDLKMKHIDFHVHTHFSADSDENPEKYIQKAIQDGLEEITFTDHYDVDYPGIDFTLDIDTYFKEMKALQTKYQDQIKINIGIEMGLDPIHQDRINQIIASYPFDYVIGSIHAIGNTEFWIGNYFDGLTKQQAQEIYFKQCIDCVKTFDCFDVFGHFDYIERYGPYGDNSVETDLYWPLIDEFLKILISKNKGLEVNTSGFRLRGQGFPKRTILERYYELGGRIITMGSDSHVVDTLGAHMDEVRKMLLEIGFKDVTTTFRK